MFSAFYEVPDTPDRIRTCDLRVRNALLYPAELRGRVGCDLVVSLRCSRWGWKIVWGLDSTFASAIKLRSYGKQMAGRESSIEFGSIVSIDSISKLP